MSLAMAETLKPESQDFLDPSLTKPQSWVVEYIVQKYRPRLNIIK